MIVLFYSEDADAARAKWSELSEGGRHVALYHSIACQQAEPVEDLVFMDDVSSCERRRLVALFGGQTDPLDNDGDGRKGGSLPHTDDAFRIAKGPGGRLYIKRGKEIVSGPFASQEEAEAALAKETAA